MKKNIHAPRKRTSLGVLSRDATKIAKAIEKFQKDCRMNMAADHAVPTVQLNSFIYHFEDLSSKLNELFQEECRSKGK